MQKRNQRIPALEFYKMARLELSKSQYCDELIWARDVNFKEKTSIDFWREYVWVVLSAGMRNQVIEPIFHKFMETNDLSLIGHPGKRKAIEQIMHTFAQHWSKVKELNDVEKIEYFASLDWIGNITKYHLAKNLGIDVAKPDRHLVRLATEYGYEDDDEVHVQKFCQDISTQTGDRIIFVDVVFWRWCNLHPNYLKMIYGEK